AAPAAAAPGSLLATEVVAARDIATLEPRWSGSGPATLRLGAFTLERVGRAETSNAPDPLKLSNGTLELDFDPADARFAVRDLRSGRLWKQVAAPGRWSAVDAGVTGDTLSALVVDSRSGRPFKLELSLDPAAPELEVALDAPGAMPADLRYPRPFAPAAGSRLVVPLNEGIAYPVDDAEVPAMRLVAYGGHGLCMSFWGVDLSPNVGKPGPGYMAVIETPDDAALDIGRVGGLLAPRPVWEPQKGEFGYTRKLRYVFFDSGGPMAMAERYRRYVRDRGGLVTLAQKRAKNPNVDLLMGAADVWYWDRNPAGMAAELKAAGMSRVLWSAEESPSVVAAIDRLGYLTGRYDIYQDVMDPAQFPRLRYVQKEWPTEAWPAGLVRDRAGNWIKGWEVEAKDGSRVSCGVLSDSLAPPIAERRIAADLADHAYRARFIDTATASPWREDYSPAHPLTRSQSREWRMRLLDLVSRRFGLVTGSETGQDAAVPYVHYFEGMMSLAPYRVPDAGRNMRRILGSAPENLLRFQLGWKYRLPLWELVYHDCVVAYWYWGDYSNKIPSVWPLRDLFNALYGTPPVYMFDAAFWKAERGRFVASYRTAAIPARLTAYAAMSGFEILSEDRSVQRSVFSNGVQVTVNFGAKPWTMEDGSVLAPGAFVLRRP
ncbi:MAG: hypothetical protein M0Z80_08070, partial [Treponema sp.]|nr:hypothetical protein [Treponema sp.]